MTCVLLNSSNKLLNFLPSVQFDFGLHAENQNVPSVALNTVLFNHCIEINSIDVSTQV